MTAFQIALLIQFTVVVAACWIKGGHPERMAAAWYLIVAILQDSVLTDFWIGGVRPLEVVLDVIIAAVFIRIAMTGQRWWPFVAGGVSLLVLMLQVCMAVDGSLEVRAYISARIGLTALILLAMLAGVIERVLSGERAAMATGRGWPRAGTRAAP